MKRVGRYLKFLTRTLSDALFSADRDLKRLDLIVPLVALFTGVGTAWTLGSERSSAVFFWILGVITLFRLTWPLFVRIEKCEAKNSNRVLLDNCLKFSEELCGIRTDYYAMPPMEEPGRIDKENALLDRLDSCQRRMLDFVENEDWCPLFDQTFRTSLGIRPGFDLFFPAMIDGYLEDLQTMRAGVLARMSSGGE